MAGKDRSTFSVENVMERRQILRGALSSGKYSTVRGVGCLRSEEWAMIFFGGIFGENIIVEIDVKVT